MSLEILSLSKQDEEEDSLSSDDNIIQCWRNQTTPPTNVEIYEHNSSIEFVQNKNIDLQKRAKEKNFFAILIFHLLLKSF